MFSIATTGLRNALPDLVVVLVNGKAAPVRYAGRQRGSATDIGIDEVEFTFDGIADGTHEVQLVVDGYYANPSYITVGPPDSAPPGGGVGLR